MSKQKGGRKLARSSKHKPKYQAQRLRTDRNKSRRAKKRADKKAYWALKKEEAKPTTNEQQHQSPIQTPDPSAAQPECESCPTTSEHAA